MGHFVNGAYIEDNELCEVLSVNGDIATVKDVETDIVFEMDAGYMGTR